MDTQEPNFTGMLLLNQFLLLKTFNEDGQFGTIYLAYDQHEQQEVLVKVSKDQQMNFKEHQIMSLLNIDHQQQLFPKIYGGGNFIDDGGQVISFIVMEKLGKNLEHYLYSRDQNFTIQTVC